MSDKILITARTFGTTNAGALALLEDAGFSCTKVDADRSPKAFLEELQESSAIILGNNPLTQEHLRQAGKLRIIAKHGSGTGNIDMDTARAMGITVTNVPTINANTMADLTFAHIMAAATGIIRADAHARRGRPFAGQEVFGKTLGFVGFGAVAQSVARRASGFKMSLVFHDPFGENIPSELLEKAKDASLEEVVRTSDIITVHVPLTDITEDMLNEETLLMMKPSAVLINLGRSDVINTAALQKVMEQGHLFAAVLQAEPQGEEDLQSPLLGLPNTTFAPPLQSFATDTISAVSQACAQNVLRKLSGEEPDFIII